MNLSQARDLLLVQSIEQADPNGNVLSASEIERAQHEALPPEDKVLSETGEYVITPETKQFLVRRAASLRESLSRDHRYFSETLDGSHWKKWAPILILAAAFLLGAAASGLGRERTINILSFPIIGMVLWNLLVYAFLAFRIILPSGKNGGSSPGQNPENALIPAQPPATGPFVRLVTWVSGFRDKHAQASSETSLRNSILAQGSSRFYSDWIRSTATLNLCRAGVVLHLGAACFALGAVAGIYTKALSFEYLAVWESTYLTSNSIHSLLGLFLGPASFVSGIALPSQEELESFRHPAGDNAGKWLHLYAVTAAIFIVIPRILLAIAGAIQSKREAGQIPLPASSHNYFQDVLRGVHGEVQTVRIYSYSYEPSGRTRDRCKELAHALWGARLDIEVVTPIAYGGEDDLLEHLTPESLADHIIVLMNLSATPEQEAHGRLVSGLRQLAAGSPRRKNSLLVLLDSASFEKKLGDLPEFDRRYDERRRTWERILQENQVTPATLRDSSSVDVHDIAQCCLRL